MIPIIYFAGEAGLCVPLWGYPTGLVGVVGRLVYLIYVVCSFFDTAQLRVVASTKQFPLHITVIILDIGAILLMLVDLVPMTMLIMVLVGTGIAIKMALVYPLVVYCDWLQYNVKYGDRIAKEAKLKAERIVEEPPSAQKLAGPDRVEPVVPDAEVQDNTGASINRDPISNDLVAGLGSLAAAASIQIDDQEMQKPAQIGEAVPDLNTKLKEEIK